MQAGQMHYTRQSLIAAGLATEQVEVIMSALTGGPLVDDRIADIAREAASQAKNMLAEYGSVSSMRAIGTLTAVTVASTDLMMRMAAFITDSQKAIETIALAQMALTNPGTSETFIRQIESVPEADALLNRFGLSVEDMLKMVSPYTKSQDKENNQ